MRIYYILPALAGVLAATPAMADTLKADDSKAQEAPPWVQVEVVVFAHADAADTEIWRDDPGVPDTAHAVTLSPALSSPDLARQLKALSGGGDQGQALAAFLNGDSGADANTKDSAPVAFRLLPDDAQQLRGVVVRLDHADGYRVLFHTAWRQPAYSPDKAVPVHIDDDPYGTQAAMLRSMDQAAGPDAGADPSSPAAPGGGDDQADTLPPSIWRINGLIEVTQSRYLHLRADLVYQVQTPPETGTGAAPDEAAGEDTAVVHTYRMEQSRRILNDKLYYFDHPEFGLVARVTPYEVPKPAPPEGQPTAQPSPDSP